MGGWLSTILDHLRTHPPLVAFAVLHLVGLHTLAGARAKRVVWISGLLLVASSAFWVRLSGVTLAETGGARSLGALGLGVLALAGVWLLVAGRGAREWLTGFTVLSLAGSGVLFLVGAKVLAGLALAANGGTVALASRWLQSRPDDAAAPTAADLATRCVAAVTTTGLLILLLGGVASQLPPDRPAESTPAPAPQTRLKDMLTKPVVPIAAAMIATASIAWSLRARFAEDPA